jgi:hypothetical protein
MQITVTKNKHGYFCETVYKGCRYAQLYSNVSLGEAKDSFRKMVFQMATGNILQVLSGNY